MSNDIDLYSDLPETTTSDYIAELENKLKILEKLVKELDADLRKSEKEKQALTKSNEILRRNISSLYMTARSEIKRKETRFNELRAEYDDVVFRRRKNDNFHRQRNEKNQGYPPNREDNCLVNRDERNRNPHAEKSPPDRFVQSHDSWSHSDKIKEEALEKRSHSNENTLALRDTRFHTDRREKEHHNFQSHGERISHDDTRNHSDRENSYSRYKNEKQRDRHSEKFYPDRIAQPRDIRSHSGKIKRESHEKRTHSDDKALVLREARFHSDKTHSRNHEERIHLNASRSHLDREDGPSISKNEKQRGRHPERSQSDKVLQSRDGWSHSDKIKREIRERRSHSDEKASVRRDDLPNCDRMMKEPHNSRNHIETKPIENHQNCQLEKFQSNENEVKVQDTKSHLEKTKQESLNYIRSHSDENASVLYDTRFHSDIILKEAVPLDDTPRKIINGEIIGFPLKYPLNSITPIRDTPDYLKEKVNPAGNKARPVVPMLNEHRVLELKSEKTVNNDNKVVKVTDEKTNSTFVEPTTDISISVITVNDTEHGAFSRKRRKRPVIQTCLDNGKKLCQSC